jgi:mannose-6-phosphate isomerase-like protein (cupin superfamily)
LPRSGLVQQFRQLELIEVQFGSYLGEVDILRLEDTYGR